MLLYAITAACNGAFTYTICTISINYNTVFLIISIGTRVDVFRGYRKATPGCNGLIDACFNVSYRSIDRIMYDEGMNKLNVKFSDYLLCEISVA